MVYVFIIYNFTDIIIIHRQVEFSNYQAALVVQNYTNFTYNSKQFEDV